MCSFIHGIVVLLTFFMIIYYHIEIITTWKLWVASMDIERQFGRFVLENLCPKSTWAILEAFTKLIVNKANFKVLIFYIKRTKFPLKIKSGSTNWRYRILNTSTHNILKCVKIKNTNIISGELIMSALHLYRDGPL